ncbi:MAG: hypothetical protein LBG72_08595 [Spirochaetaceae bacterium]|nr:hypothetical protein [Spirochaetaceae bacterium]
MSFPQQNVLFRIAAVFSVLTLAIFLLFSRKLFPVFSGLTAVSSRRAAPAMAAIFKQVNTASPFWALTVALIFAALTLICILYFFEHTPSPEIHYFGLFAFSFTFEAFRAALALQFLRLFSPFLLMIACRALIFFRFWALAALLAAGLFAAGFKPQRENSLLLPFTIVALIVACRIPLDIYSFNSALSPVLGFSRIFAVVELALALTACVSFFVGAYQRGIKEYAPAGAGVIMLAIGRNILQNADVLPMILLALAMLIGGLYLFCANVRKIYMWL